MTRAEPLAGRSYAAVHRVAAAAVLTELGARSRRSARRPAYHLAPPGAAQASRASLAVPNGGGEGTARSLASALEGPRLVTRRHRGPLRFRYHWTNCWDLRPKPAETAPASSGWVSDGYSPPPLPPPGLAPPQGAGWSLVIAVPAGGGPGAAEGLDSGHPELDRWLEEYLRTVSFPRGARWAALSAALEPQAGIRKTTVILS